MAADEHTGDPPLWHAVPLARQLWQCTNGCAGLPGIRLFGPLPVDDDDEDDDNTINITTNNLPSILPLENASN